MERLCSTQYFDAFSLHQYQLSNGMEVLWLDNPISKVASCMLYYHVGSAVESEQERGLAHFFEHMMFRQTKNLKDGDFDRLISQVGGVDANAFTTYDATVYQVSVPCEGLEQVLALEAERMQHLQLDGAQIESERGAVLGELRMYEDMPSEQLWRTAMQEAYPTHPYQHPIIGHGERIAAFNTEDFQQFYQRYYAPNHATLVIAGGCEETALLDAIQQHFEEVKPRPTQDFPHLKEKTWQKSATIELSHPKISSMSSVLLWQSMGMKGADFPALLMTCVLLGGGRSGPMEQALVQEGHCTFATISPLEPDLMMKDTGLIVAELEMQQGQQGTQAEAAFDQMLSQMHNHQRIEEELERTCRQLRLQTYASLSTNMGLATQIGGSHIACGNPLYAQQLFEAAQQVTPQQIYDVIERYLRNAPRISLHQRPEKTLEND